MKAILILTLIISTGLIISGCSSDREVSNTDITQETTDNSQIVTSDIEPSEEIDPDIGELDDLQVSDEIPAE
jgi:hypothetical protein